MIYTGQFRDITDDANLYTVTISTNTGNQTRDITLGAEPFITEMDGSSGNIYVPVKYQAATVSVISSDYMFDVYSSKAQDTKVELKKGSTLIWTGYATPNLYNQGFVEEREEFQIECIDGLSTLQYIKYKAENKQILSFAEIIFKILKQCNCYSYFIFSENTKLQQASTSNIISELYISEENFFDKKNDDENDEDVAWTCRDVLEEICRYLGVTCIADGASVLFLDYDSIKGGNPKYTIYSLKNDTISVSSKNITRCQRLTITGDDYAASDATLSLTDTYNKVTVKDDLYTFEQISPDIFNNGQLTNVTTDAPATKRVDNRIIRYYDPMTGLGISPATGPSWIESQNEYIIDKGASGRKEHKYYFVASQYFKHPNITPYLYIWNNNSHPSQAQQIAYPEKIGWDDLQTYYGCVIRKEFVSEVDENKVVYWETISEENAIKHATEEITKLNYSNYLMFCVCGKESAPYFFAGGKTKDYDRLYDTQHQYLKMFDYNIPKSAVMFGGKFAYLLISGSFVLGHNDFDAYNKGSFNYSDSYKSNVRGQWEYVYCRLQWGNRYWNGDDWQTTACDFMLFFDEDKNKKIKEITYKDLKIRNTTSWWFGINKEGYAIPVPDNEVLSEDIKFTMYTPMQQYDDAMNESGQHDGRSYYIWLKDFKIDAVLGNLYYNVDFDSDTVYTNIINDDYVNELSEIKFKICTWDNKKPNFSAVAYKQDNKMYYLDKTYNVALHPFENDFMEDSDAVNGLRQEEHLICRLVRQYTTPCKQLELSLHNKFSVMGLYKDTAIGDATEFIVDKMNINYKNDLQEITLIEKK